MFDLTALTPYVVALLAVAGVASVLAVATIARVVAETRAPRRQPVVLVTSERATTRAAA